MFSCIQQLCATDHDLRYDVRRTNCLLINNANLPLGDAARELWIPDTISNLVGADQSTTWY